MFDTSTLDEIRALTFEKSFNSLIFVLRILAIYETRIDSQFTFGLFNQLEFDGVDWELTMDELNDESFYNQIVEQAASNLLIEIEIINFVKSQYLELVQE